MERELKSPASKERKQAKERKAAARGGGLSVPALLHHPGSGPSRRDGLGVPDRRHHRRGRQGRLRAEERRGPQVLVDAGHQRGRLEVLPRHPGHARARDQRPAAHRPRGRTPSPRWGQEGGYFATEADARTFHAELTHLLLHQKAAFNSPVWFNVGVEAQPQCSACFINSVEDTMESILGLAKTEGMLFKYGSGTGTQPLAPPLAARSCSPAAARPPARCPS